MLRGRLRLWQPRSGYRFSLDPLLLADFVLARAGEGELRALDLGAGVGILALVLASQRAAWQVEAIELQDRLARIAQKNIDENGLRIALHHADVRARTLPGGVYDLVVTNPPYFRLSDGPASPDPELAIARHERELELAAWVGESKRLLKPGALLCCVFPVTRLEELLATLGAAGLQSTTLRFVHSLADRPAELVLVAAKKRDGRGAPALQVLPPLVIYDEPGTYTREANRILEESGW